MSDTPESKEVKTVAPTPAVGVEPAPVVDAQTAPGVGAALPKDWERHVVAADDPIDGGRDYYVNTKTGKSVWSEDVASEIQNAQATSAANTRRALVILLGLVLAGGGAAAVTYFLFPAAITAIATLFAFTGPLALILPLVAVGLVGALFGMELLALLERAITGNEARNRVFMRNLIIATTLLAGLGLGLFLAATTPIILNFAIGLVGPGIGAYALVGAAGLVASALLAGILVGGARAITAIAARIAAPKPAPGGTAAAATPDPHGEWLGNIAKLQQQGVKGVDIHDAYLGQLATGVEAGYGKQELARCLELARQSDPRSKPIQPIGGGEKDVLIPTPQAKLYDSLGEVLLKDTIDVNATLKIIRELNPAIVLTIDEPAGDEVTLFSADDLPLGSGDAKQARRESLSAVSLLAAGGGAGTKQTEVKVASAAELKEAAAFEPLATTPTALDRRDSKAAASATEAAAAAQQKEQPQQPDPGKDKDTSGQSGPSTPA